MLLIQRKPACNAGADCEYDIQRADPQSWWAVPPLERNFNNIVPKQLVLFAAQPGWAQIKHKGCVLIATGLAQVLGRSPEGSFVPKKTPFRERKITRIIFSSSHCTL